MRNEPQCAVTRQALDAARCDLEMVSNLTCPSCDDGCESAPCYCHEYNALRASALASLRALLARYNGQGNGVEIHENKA